jgi:phage terminase small subunit|tara:strand:+ start:1160 stop:1705 length:546 start_codon:yes stop_codon:yes gene_type:complete
MLVTMLVTIDQQIDGGDMREKKPALRLVAGDGKPAKKKRPLTAKQERFVAEMIRGATQADAYRTAYGDGKLKMKPSAVYTEAGRLMAHPEITRRLLAAQASVERSAVSSALSKRRWIVERLEHEAEHAQSDAGRVRALELLGKVTEVALFTDRVEQIDSELSPDQLRDELQQRLLKLVDDG